MQSNFNKYSTAYINAKTVLHGRVNIAFRAFVIVSGVGFSVTWLLTLAITNC